MTKKEAIRADSEDSNSGSSKTGDDKQPRFSDTSLTASYPSSTSATDPVSSVARQSTDQSIALLPSLPAAAAAAAVAAAPTIQRSEKKAATPREQFLPKLRIMLDRESLNESDIVQWSTDGSSFIVMDQNQFEDRTIPSYFDKPIAFASFVRKLYRYGFNQLPSSRTGHYKFCSMTFIRAGPKCATAPADKSGNSGRSASTTNFANAQASSPLPQVTAHTNHPTAPNPLVNQTDATQAVFSNNQRNNQQPPLPLPSQQYIYGNNILQGNSDHTMNLLRIALNNLVTSPTSIPQSNAAVQSLLLLMHRLGEEERQRRAQADALQSAILTAIGQLLGQGESVINEQERQGRTSSALEQTIGRTNNNDTVQNQHGVPPTAGYLNFQADPIAPILQASQRGEAGLIQQGTYSHQNSSQGDSDNGGGDDEDDDQQHAGPLFSRRKRKSPDDDEDGQYDADDDSLKDRLRPSKK